MQKTKQFGRHLLFALLVLFWLQIILWPAAFGVSYASSSQSPEHIITYTAYALHWDRNTQVETDGTARLDLFEAAYPNVSAENAQKVLAPGTKNDTILRLVNEEKETLRYTAVLYRYTSDKSLAAKAELLGEGFSDTEDYPLPSGIDPASVVRAVRGELGGGQMQQFIVDWTWRFEGENEGDDAADTALGDLSAAGEADTVSVGFYLVAEQDGNKVIPQPPKTGDEAALWRYLCGAVLSGGVLAVLILTRKNRRVAK